jgi:hypothetical protein
LCEGCSPVTESAGELQFWSAAAANARSNAPLAQIVARCDNNGFHGRARRRPKPNLAAIIASSDDAIGQRKGSKHRCVRRCRVDDAKNATADRS